MGGYFCARWTSHTRHLICGATLWDKPGNCRLTSMINHLGDCWVGLYGWSRSLATGCHHALLVDNRACSTVDLRLCMNFAEAAPDQQLHL